MTIWILATICLMCSLWLLARVVDVTSRPRTGDVVAQLRISLMARLKAISAPAVVTLLALVYGALARPDGWLFLLWALAPMLLVVTVPRSLVLTTDGLQQGRKSFHRWTEFAGVQRFRGGVMLTRVNSGRGVLVWLSGHREDDELIHLMRTLMRQAYKGSTVTIARPESPRPAGSTPDRS